MTENLETKTKVYKIKTWEKIIPLIGTIAYAVRGISSQRDSQLSSNDYANAISYRTVGLAAKDIALGTLLYFLIK